VWQHPTEVARATIDWAFDGAICDDIDAVIFGPLNLGSSAVAIKLGMMRTGTLRFDAFLPEQQLGRDVLDHEIWRLREGACLDFKSLLFQAPFKAGLLVSAGVASEAETLQALLVAARQHPDRRDFAEADIDRFVGTAFRRGVTDCELDVFQISRAGWTKRQSGNWSTPETDNIIGRIGLEPGIRCAPPQLLLAVKTNNGPFGQLRHLTPNESFWSNKAAGKTFSVLEGSWAAINRRQLL
jgi:hypothetical protein